MGSLNVERLISQLMGPSLLAIVVTAVVALSIPLLLHLFIYRSNSSTTLPSFLLIGPSSSGKTSLLTLFERGDSATTHTSQAPLSVEVSLPISKTASSRYRSINDPSLQTHKLFLLIDTPGHGKLRYHALDNVTKPQNLKGIIFVVDAANMSSGVTGQDTQGLREAAEYLHDILLLLQKRSTESNTSKAPKEMPVLVAANKMDLFTALPAPLVKTALEAEITNVRNSRSKGLLDSGIGMGDTDLEEEKGWLGDGGEGKFELSQMEEVNVSVTVAGGNVIGSEGADVKNWWDWIGDNL
ncbi:MAG: hypothetical protein M1827_002671 [Pycnora praestabilis]|nr:MAG: hypothetical protein M1827_002671 [Pycnora praestabilis]